MNRSRIGRATICTALTALAVTASACGSRQDASALDRGVASTSEVLRPSGHSSTGLSNRAAVRMIRRHLQAVAASDITAYMQPLAADVRFDIAGTIYQGRTAVRGWALRDPIGQGGRYEIHALTPIRSGVVAIVTFRAGGLVEQIRYRYTIRSGKVADMVGRYRD